MFGLCAFDVQALSAASKEMKTQFKKNKELDISYIDKMQDDMFDMMVRGMGLRGGGVVDLQAGLLVRGPREGSGVDLETHRRLPLHVLATVHTFPHTFHTWSRIWPRRSTTPWAAPTRCRRMLMRVTSWRSLMH